MTTYTFPEREKLEELLDVYFPKGKCKERGSAIVLVSTFICWLGKRQKNPEFMDLKDTRKS